MFKNVDPSDVSVKQFVTNKRFTVTDIDSGSGVFGLTGTSSSNYAFAVDTADKTTFTNTTAPFSHSFFHIPVYRQIKHMYYRDWPNPYNSYCFASESIRKLHGSLTAITVPREFYGEKINPGSIELTDDSADSTFTIMDDRKGNLYDNNFSSSFAQRSASANGSGSQVGNIFYEHGILVFTDTDLLTDITWVSKQDMFGRNNITPMADNGRLVINALESMSGGANLIGLRGRGVSNRPFLVVENIQKNAELSYREKELSLQNELEDTEKMTLNNHCNITPTGI